MKKLTTGVMKAFLVCGFLFLLSMPLSASPPPLPATDRERWQAMADAGKMGDYSLVPAMISALQEKPLPHPTRVLSIAHSLALLGAVEALPALDGVITDKSSYADVVSHIKTQKARLLAEDSAKGMGNGRLAAKTKVERFYQELKLSPAGINAAVAIYNKNATRPEVVTPVELFAVEELADMVYRGRYADYAALPGIVQVNFALNFYAALKLRLAPLPHEERLRFLIDDAAHRKVINEGELSLALDQGAGVGPAAAAKLWQMDQNRADYTHAGWESLFQLLRSTPLQEQYQALWQHFQSDADPDIKEAANSGLVCSPGY